jgi:uncharacterized protein YndB with AHSA1/START domain
MTRTVTIAPVRKSLRVNAPPATAFDVFTAGIDLWWPKGHHIGASPMKAAIIEPFVGGRWYHICEDGSQTDNGRVLHWQPPERLVLTWQINGNWQYDPDLVTEVEVQFIADGAGATRVEFEHRHLERLGDTADAFRAQVDPGWGGLLDGFAKAAAEFWGHNTNSRAAHVGTQS